MPDASSPYLNQPIRSEAEARRELHSPAFCRDILDHAFRRVEDPKGGRRFVLVDQNGCAVNGVRLVGMSFDEAYEAAGRPKVIPLVGDVE